jgi:6-phosphogluconolactonase
MTTVPQFLEFETRNDASAALAGNLADTLRAAIGAEARASMVVGGGTTPGPMFRALRSQPVPWERITVVPSDERWVPLEDAASNEGMIRRELLMGPAKAARLISLYRPGSDPDSALPAVARDLAEVKRPFDAIVLGMGADGHTASLFPDAPGIDRTLRSSNDAVVQRLARLAQPRVSLTVRALLDAHEIDLLFFGTDKRAVYERAMRPGPAAELPIRTIVRQSAVPVTVYWAP